MATFPAITPTYGASQQSSPMTTTVQFGDGYQQRLLVGMSKNLNPKVWRLTWFKIDVIVPNKLLTRNLGRGKVPVCPALYSNPSACIGNLK